MLFIAGDLEALRWARRAPVLTATSRESEVLKRGAVELDALIGSGEDEAERYHAGDLDPEPKLVVTTSGALGGWMQPGGPFVAAPVPGPREDTYGAGDSFMAGLTYALGAGLEAHDAVVFAARCGAAALTGRGVAPQPVASDSCSTAPGSVTCQYAGMVRPRASVGRRRHDPRRHRCVGDGRRGRYGDAIRTDVMPAS